VLENRLGAGAYGTVFSVTGFSNIVVKASQGSGSYDCKITNEIKVLTAFNSGISKCVNIPQLQNTGILAVSVRGSRVDLKAFVTRPKGVPIDHLCTQLHDTIEQKILLVAEGVRAALDFAHRISWFYLDVRPSNIVFELEGQKVKRAILIEL
jgi:serine/threonine protein kinase